ncbi:MAG: radical SAM protein [Candidatus Omnitrophica bacterium]|nr:radical SAM protein [Candidatus Omnitrophota bacterium]
MHHLTHQNWLVTPTGEPRGYIQLEKLTEVWFHTGTICNLSCPFCLEGSKPGDDRLNKMTIDDIRPFIHEAVALGVEKFSFTGGEPFVIKDMIQILDQALEFRPCLILTNGTEPLQRRLSQLKPLVNKPHALSFRISLDYPDPKRHDAGRGEGQFHLAMRTMKGLTEMGFSVSIARQMDKDEEKGRVRRDYQKHFRENGLPEDTRIVPFPDFLTPGSMAKVPHITEDCMTRYHTQDSRGMFMCSFSRMVVKINSQMRVYACTLVDDDNDYDLGGTLAESRRPKVMMKHHRCYSCFAHGASCSES